MKRNLLKPAGIFILLAFAMHAKAQQNLPERIRTNKGISKHFTKLAAAEQIPFNTKKAREIFNLDPNSDLVLKNTETDKLGFIHYRYYQTYKGFPVENSMYVVHTKAGKLTGMSGVVVTDFDPQMNKEASQKISELQSIDIAVKQVHAKLYAWQDATMEQRIKMQTGDRKASYKPKASLVWYCEGAEIVPAKLRLCYKVDIYAKQPLSRAYYFVDAITGKVIGKKDEIFFNDATGTAATAYSGNQTIHSDFNGTNYTLRDYTKGYGIITLHGESGFRGNDYTSSSSNWNLSSTDIAALDAHYGVTQTYLFYKANFNRNSYDDAGTALYSYINDPTYIDNAFWDGSVMNFCKRSDVSQPGGVTGIDVTGHELTHGVTQTTSGLIYQNESGSMNESLSDIIGKSVQFWSKPSDINWAISNDMNWLIRDMSNPNAYNQPDTYLGTYWYTGTNQDALVHTNSGVGNFMFYLLVSGGSGTNDIGTAYNVSGIGLSEADQIIYRTETVYLSPSSQYADWRTACINAATDLYGAFSNEVIQVENAWHAVGVGDAGGEGCNAIPTGLTTINIFETTATASWDTVAGIDSYNLQYQQADSAWITISVPTSYYNFTGLTPGTIYNLKVQTVCSNGITSPASAPVPFKTNGIRGDIKYAVGGSADDNAQSIWQTSDSGYIIASWSNSNDGYVSGNHGGMDCWLIKTDKAENIQWQKIYGGSGDDYPESIQQTADGGYIIAGYSNSNDGDVTGNHGNYDYWIVKLDGAGNIQWQKSYGGSEMDEAYGIEQTADGGYIVAGWSGSNDEDVTGNHGDFDYWILKLDGSGNLQWQKSLGGSSVDYASGIQQTTDGGYVVAGYTFSNDGDVAGNHGNYDYWIVKLNSTGTMQWQKTYGGSGNDYLENIHQTTDGGYIAAGSSTSSNGDVADNHGNIDYWILKIDGSGILQWQKSLGGSADDNAKSILQTPDGGYAVAGYSNSVDGDIAGAKGGNDYWIVKLDQGGNIYDKKLLGGTGDDYAACIRHINDNNFIVAGYSNSDNGDVLGNQGNFDCWITQVQLKKLGNINRPVGGSSNDFAQSIRQTSDGGYIVSGASGSNGIGYNNHGNYDYLVLKANSAGNIQWQKEFGGNGSDFSTTVAQSPDGGYITTGYSISVNGNITGNHGDYDCWIVKTDSFGTMQWQKSLGGSNTDAASNIQPTADGGYIVAGWSNSNDGDVTSNHGDYDYWVVKLDNSGNLQWQKSLGGSGDDEAKSIQQTTDGGYIVAGYSSSNDGNISGNHGEYDYWVVKLDESGTTQWQKSYGGSNSEAAYGIQQTIDGGYIVAGWSNSNDGDVTGNHGDYDYWVVKLDNSGNLQWQKSLGGTGDDEAYDVQQAADGGYVVAGFAGSADGNITGNHGSYDYWVVSLDTNGNMIEEKSLGGSNGDYAQSICKTKDGNYMIAGYSISVDGDVSGNNGGSDYWITKTDLCTLKQTFYRDADEDGFGDASNSVQNCTQPYGYVADNTDCNDNNATVHSAQTCYADNDNDGFGDTNNSISVCSSVPPAGYVTDNTDCDDTKLLYADNDDDGFGAGTPVACGVDNNADCNDDDATVHSAKTYYADNDNDGFGDANNPINVCSSVPPAGYVTNNTDCDDAKLFYADNDDDGFGAGSPVACGVDNNADCNDNNAAVHPGAVEICGNGIDDNCNGQIDEGCTVNKVKITITDKSVKEGNKGVKLMRFNVKLNKRIWKKVTVNYATQDGTATAGSDYTPASGKITFRPGVKATAIFIIINGDKIPEADESFDVVLSNAVNAAIAKSVGVGKIVNNDGAAIASVPSTQKATAISLQTIKLFPNPAQKKVNVTLKGYSGNVVIQLSDMRGRKLAEYKKIITSKFAEQQIDISRCAGGIYFITVIDEKGNRHTAKLIIAK